MEMGREAVNKINRELDGYYFRVKRGEHWDNICFSDLTHEERIEVLEGRSVDWLKSLCCGLASQLRFLGDTFNIVAEDSED